MIRTCLHTLNQSPQFGDLELLDRWRREGGFLWLDIQQSIDEPCRQLLSSFGCHNLAIKDVARERHPPKFEVFNEHSFIIFRGIQSIDENLIVTPLQLSFFVGENYIITVHPGPSVSVDFHLASPQLGELITAPKHLALSIMHYASGRYLDSLLAYDAELADMEEAMLNRGSDELLKDLVRDRSQLRKMRRTFTYHSRLAAELVEFWDVDAADNELSHRLRDLYDRCERLDTLSAQHYEICGDLVDGYFSLSAHQLNNTMRVLTVITAIFVPLSFLAGLYGMNFEYIPELQMHNGYFILLTVMGLLAVGMIYIFKKKRWF
ncbi:MAG TPA: magnesium transporter CorA family protein [Pseudomonadales bacterium]|nr:magnesium transporter CorA family protein [Pseudomonadales bacterium]